MTAFVLSGGGNQGIAQVGMLRALLERGIQPDVIVGTSAGALNGAAIATSPDPREGRPSRTGVVQPHRRAGVPRRSHPQGLERASPGRPPHRQRRTSGRDRPSGARDVVRGARGAAARCRSRPHHGRRARLRQRSARPDPPGQRRAARDLPAGRDPRAHARRRRRREPRTDLARARRARSVASSCSTSRTRSASARSDRRSTSSCARSRSRATCASSSRCSGCRRTSRSSSSPSPSTTATSSTSPAAKTSSTKPTSSPRRARRLGTDLEENAPGAGSARPLPPCMRGGSASCQLDQRVASSQLSGTPFKVCSPRSVKVRPEPVVRSLTVRETHTSPGPARVAMREPMLTPMPPTSSPRRSTSPVCTPARISTPRESTASRIAHALDRA